MPEPDDVFEMHCDPIDVTSLHRPDTSWRVVDAHGHEHRWYVNGTPAGSYNPSATHETPTLVWIFEEWGFYEDGERYAIGHHECKECSEHIEPRYTSDENTQLIPGLRWYLINGEPITPEAFERRYRDAMDRGRLA